MAISLVTPSPVHALVPSPAGEGTTLCQSARRMGLQLNTRCGEKGLCRGCGVWLRTGSYRVGAEQVTANPEEPHFARSCQTVPLSLDGEVFIPGTSLLETSAQIEEEFLLGSEIFDPLLRLVTINLPPEGQCHESDADRLYAALGDQLDSEIARRMELADWRQLPTLLAAGAFEAIVAKPIGGPAQILALRTPTPRLLGLAIDIGTTTVVCALVDLESGRVLRKAARLNGQIGCADDVASRISWAMDSAQNLDELQRQLIAQTINPMVQELCRVEGVSPDSIMHVVAAGNTVMTHLLLRLPPDGIGRLPFNPVTNVYPEVRAAALHLDVHPQALVECLPSVSAYVGGDVVADMLSCHFADGEETSLLIDIGTNGEIVLAHGGCLYATATAAGPAFEGYGLLHGCRAATGAIERIRLAEDLQPILETIGGTQPIGICGSAIIDFIAEAMRRGILSSMGRLDVDALQKNGVYTTLSYDGRCSHGFRLCGRSGSATGQEIAISEADIAQILKAKGAIFAGIRTLLEEHGLAIPDIRRIFLAGGFARYINLENAITMGLLPDLPRTRYTVIGNGSLAGACLLLRDRAARARARELARLPIPLELSQTEIFNDEFLDAMMLPHGDESLFPSVYQPESTRN